MHVLFSVILYFIYILYYKKILIFVILIIQQRYIKLIKKCICNCNNILQYYCFYCIFDQINATLVRLHSKTFNYYLTKNFFFSIV